MIRVMVVDDSALMRAILCEVVGGEPDMEVVATASDPYLARDKFRTLHPDVVTLDIEMPRMDGLTFLEKLMQFRPTPVIMVSSRTVDGAGCTLEALARGAVDFVEKPSVGRTQAVEALRRQLLPKIRSAMGARVHRNPKAGPSKTPAVDAYVPRRELVCIGASTGGTVALERLLRGLPAARMPPIAVVQHMPAGFTKAFADRLDSLCELRVVEASDGMDILPDTVVIAPGGQHLTLVGSLGALRAQLRKAPPVNRHRPSVDAMFLSVPDAFARRTLAILLTGMGEDGARGLEHLARAGSATVAQDENTCVVFGMPKAAIQRGAAQRVESLDGIRGLLRGLVVGHRSPEAS